MRTAKEWGKGVINPIPKASTKDFGDPSQYRGITISSAVYKLYCAILNNRLTHFVEMNHILADEQNGFRKDRGCQDHIFTLASVLENRKLSGLSTFTAFIDFKSAFDRIDRDALFYKLLKCGINGNMYNAIKSLYSSIISTVRINGLYTNWFDIKNGVRQGCLMSTTLFNIFLNDLVAEINNLNLGIYTGRNQHLSILAYADDII